MTSFARLTDYIISSPHIREDMDRRYQHTYMTMKLPKTGEIVPVNYAGSAQSKYVFQKENGDYVELPLTDTTEINILMPKVGYYNLRGNPFYIIKSPQRQWKRSLCSSIYQILPPIKNIENRTERLPSSYWFALAKECLNTSYASLDDIQKQIFANIALNNKFVVAKDTNNIPILVYKRYKVAVLDFNSRSVIVTEPLLLQEVRDLFKYTGVTTWTLRQTPTE